MQSQLVNQLSILLLYKQAAQIDLEYSILQYKKLHILPLKNIYNALFWHCLLFII